MASDPRLHADLLSQVELFRGLDRLSLAKLSAYLEPVSVQAREILFRQGDRPDGLYLVTRGTFSIYAETDGSDGTAGEVHFSTCGRGDSFGEIALLTGETRSATVRADEEGEFLRLDQARFLDLVRRDPSVSLAISAGLIRRLRAADIARLGGASPNETMPLDERAPARLERPRWQPRRIAGVALATLVVLAGWLIPPPSDLPVSAWHALFSLVALVPLLALDALPEGATSLLLIAVWVLGGIVTPRAALSGFSSTTWILTVSMFTVGAAVAASGLLYRLSLWSVARGAGFVSQVITLGFSGLVLGAAIPNATSRMTLVASAITELAEALGYQYRSRAAAGLGMAALVSFGQMAAPFSTSSSSTLVAYALLSDASKVNLNWIVWAERAAPLHIILLVGLLGFILWRFAPRGPAEPRLRAAAFGLQRALLGPPTRHERLAGLVAVGLLCGFATQPLHGIDPAWVAVIAFVVMAGGGVLTLDTLRAVNWNTVLLLGVLASMAEVVSSSRLDAWLGAVTASTVGGLGSQPLLFVVVLALACMVLSLVLRWQAAVPLIVIALSPVARGAGIDPWVVAIVTLTASNTFFLPYQSTIYLALFTGGGSKLFTHAQARPVALAYALLVLVGLVASVPVWHVMGLL